MILFSMPLLLLAASFSHGNYRFLLCMEITGFSHGNYHFLLCTGFSHGNHQFLPLVSPMEITGCFSHGNHQFLQWKSLFSRGNHHWFLPQKSLADFSLGNHWFLPWKSPLVSPTEITGWFLPWESPVSPMGITGFSYGITSFSHWFSHRNHWLVSPPMEITVFSMEIILIGL